MRAYPLLVAPPRALWLLFFLSLAASAQEPRPALTNREQAMLRLHGLAARIEDMTDDGAKVLGLSLLGEYTCKEDPSLAHGLFEKAVKLARPLQQETAQGPSSVPAQSLWSADRKSPGSRTWQSLLARIGACDANYAYQLNEQQEKDEKNPPDPASDLRLASQLALDQPDQAANFANRAVSGTVTEDILRALPNILWRLRERSKERADAIFLKTLQSLAFEPRADGVRLLLLGNYLFGAPTSAEGAASLHIISYTTVGDVNVPSIMAPRFEISPELARQYLEASYDILARPTTDIRQDRVDYAAAFQMRHQARRYAPSLVWLFSSLLERLAAKASQNNLQQATSDLDQKAAWGSAQTLEEYQKERSPDRRAGLRAVTFRSLIKRGEFEDARRVARDTDDGREVDALISLVDFMEAAAAIEKREVERVDEFIEKQKEPLKKVLLQTGLSAILAKQGNRNRAFEVLVIANRQTTHLDSNSRPRLLLAQSGVMAGLAPSEGLRVLEEAVVAFNELEVNKPESSTLITASAPPGSGRALPSPIILATARGIAELAQFKGGLGRLSFNLEVPGVEDYDFSLSFLMKQPLDDERAEAIVARLKDETLRATALAGLGAAYLISFHNGGANLRREP